MCDAAGGDIKSGHCNSSEEFENTNVGGTMPAYEEITTMKTEVIEECYDYGTLDGVKPIGMSEDLQSVTDEDPVTSPYEQILQNDHSEKHMVRCKDRNNFGLSGDVAAKDDKKYGHFTKKKPKGEKLFKCETCGSSFKGKINLTKHVKIHDDKWQKKLPCPYCNKTYYASNSLQCHIDVKHAHKKYKCGLCGYTTSYKYILKRHELLKHDNEDKLYRCKYCEHSAHYKTALQTRERTHSNVLLKCMHKNCRCEQQCVSNQEESCECDLCQFDTACTIKHTVIHTNAKIFKCTYMNCKCNSVRGKPCNCTTCSYQTVNQHDLKIHILVNHSGEAKKYACTFCDFSSHIKAHLKKHLLCIHANAKSVPSENS